MKSLIALMITGLLASAGALAQESKSAAPAPAAPAAAAPSAGAPTGEEPAKKAAHHRKKHHRAMAKADTEAKKSGGASSDAAKAPAPAASSDMKK
jgi:hypothetical protein